MKENLIKTIQKFLNTPFRYAALIFMLDKQKDFLMKPDILEKADEFEYNALWDTINELEKLFLYAKQPEGLSIGVQVSVLRIFERNLKERKEYKRE